MPAQGPALPAFFALAGLVATIACDTAPAPIHTIHTDSAGISIVTSAAPQWGPGEGWTVDDEPFVEIGAIDGAPEYLFSEVVAAVRLSNGNIVVADRGASELRSYDAAGNFQWSAGRFGEGPGEFESLDYVGVMAGDSLVTHDATLLRAQVFGPHGELARTFRVAITEDAGEGAVADKAVGVVDGLLVVRLIEYGDMDEMPTGIVRWPEVRLAALDLGDGAVRSLAVLPGHETHVRIDGDRWSTGRYVFAKGPEFAAAARSLTVIDTEAWSVSLVSPRDGAIYAVYRRDVLPREATTALLDLHLDGILDLLPDDAPAEQVDLVEQIWRDRPRAPVLPVLRSIHADATGHLWLAPYYVAGADPPPFEVHAPDGTWLGSVSVPPGLQRAFIQYQAPYMEIGEDYILGVWTDDLDVQYVRMYRINK